MAPDPSRVDLVRVPGADASVTELVEFAATYDAYEYFAAGPEHLDALIGELHNEISESGSVPEWVQIDVARALLFYAYRADRFSGGEGPYDAMYALADHIGRLTGGWVERRTRPDAPTLAAPATSGSATVGRFEDSWEYSPDGVYRWWYERRWAPGPTLCFVGLNPATGDTDGKPRPTLNKVVKWAEREGCGGVVVVNLFAYRATNPAALQSAAVDIVGHRNDDTLRQHSATAQLTLAAWGAHRLANARAHEVIPMLQRLHCAGVTKHGAPAHPLYVPTARPLQPFP